MRRARRQVIELVERYGFDVDPDARVEDISVGMQQRTEILKALYRGADILILDEPTAVLTPQEADKLIEIMHELVSSGKTIIIITHKLQEIMRSADECTIIRRGVWQGTLDVAQASEAELAARMVGHAVSLHVEKGPATPGDVVLDIRDLHVRDARGIEQVCGLDLSVRAGEIVGVAGIDGNGQSELVDAIMSLAHADAGSICVAGEELQNTSPQQVIAHGVATIPSDRHRYGLVLPMSVMENAVLGYHANGSFGTGGRLDEQRMHDFATRLIETYDIRPEGCEYTPISALSGGNQQKLIIGRSVESAQ
jgi:simple sugar transport system ATP-binding protein